MPDNDSLYGSSNSSSETNESVGSLADFIVDDTGNESEGSEGRRNNQDYLEIVDYIMLALSDLRFMLAGRERQNSASGRE